MSAFTERERGVTEAGRWATHSAEATVTLRRMPLLSGLQKLRQQRTGLLVCRNPGNRRHSKAVAAHPHLLQQPRKWLTVFPGKASSGSCQQSLAAAGSAFQILCKWCLGHNSYWSRAGRGPQEVGSPGFSPRMRSTANSTEDKLAQDCFPVSLLTMGTERLKL